MSLVPNYNIRKPSSLIFLAALISLSWVVLHLEQIQYLISGGKLSTMFRQTRQVLDDLKNLIYCQDIRYRTIQPSQLSIVQNILQPQCTY